MKIKSITKLDKKEYTYDIEVSGTHSYQLSNGVVSHNTVSSLCNTSSGIHKRHSRYYIRTVRNDKKDPLSDFMISEGLPYEQDLMSPTNWVFSFPFASPKNAVLNQTALEQLKMWKFYKTYWCHHNASITVTVAEKEWLEVGAWVYENFNEVLGISFLPASDHIYKQAPFQSCSEEEYLEFVKKMPKNINWANLSNFEKEDQTTSAKEYACTSGYCEII